MTTAKRIAQLTEQIAALKQVKGRRPDYPLIGIKTRILRRLQSITPSA